MHLHTNTHTQNLHQSCFNAGGPVCPVPEWMSLLHFLFQDQENLKKYYH